MFNAADYDYHPQSITDNPQSQAFINERLRTWMTVQTSENVEAYVQAQIGHVACGARITTCPRRSPRPERPTTRWA